MPGKVPTSWTRCARLADTTKKSRHVGSDADCKQVGSSERMITPWTCSSNPRDRRVSGEVFQSPAMMKGRSWDKAHSATQVNSCIKFARVWPTVR
eukprot:4421436-Amphidinium_carterae.2